MCEIRQSKVHEAGGRGPGTLSLVARSESSKGVGSLSKLATPFEDSGRATQNRRATPDSEVILSALYQVQNRKRTPAFQPYCGRVCAMLF
jgi:hypothetical protein